MGCRWGGAFNLCFFMRWVPALTYRQPGQCKMLPWAERDWWLGYGAGDMHSTRAACVCRNEKHRHSHAPLAQP